MIKQKFLHFIFNAKALHIFYLFCCLFLVFLLNAESNALATSSPAFNENNYKNWLVHGYLESENYIFINQKNQQEINKIEEHVFLDTQYNKENVYARAIFQGYLYPSNDNLNGNTDRLQVHELYLNYTSNYFDCRIGRQVIRWGTSDTLNPTSYFTPLDFREMFLKEEDEFFLGADSLDLQFYLQDFSLEFVLEPISSASQLPREDSEWALNFKDLNGVPVNYRHRSLDRNSSFENMSYGMKFTGYLPGFDFSLSAYHGIDRDVLLLPVPGSETIPVSRFNITPLYENFTAFGLDLAFPLGRSTFYAEGIYSCDKIAIARGDLSKNELPGTKEKDYVKYVTGVNWLIDGDSLRLILEYHQSHYLGDNGKLFEPFVKDTVAASFQRMFFNRTVTSEIQLLFNTKDSSFLFMPRIEYELNNELTFEIETAIFEGDEDTLLGNFDNNDLVSLKARFDF